MAYMRLLERQIGVSFNPLGDHGLRIEGAIVAPIPVGVVDPEARALLEACKVAGPELWTVMHESGVLELSIPILRRAAESVSKSQGDNADGAGKALAFIKANPFVSHAEPSYIRAFGAQLVGEAAPEYKRPQKFVRAEFV